VGGGAEGAGAAADDGKIGAEEFYERMSGTTRGLYSVEDCAADSLCVAGAGVRGCDAGRAAAGGSRRVQTGILSNTNFPHWSRYEASIAVRRSSHGVAAFQPAREPSPGVHEAGGGAYEAFELATGFAGAEILFLEDLPENLAAAVKRGWVGELIDYTRETAPQIEAVLTRHGLI
jgi:hypothetical protein